LRALRRLLQVVALVGTLLVGVVALALIVSQTPWFRDWLRRYIVRESKQYLNGELSIGSIDGNLLFGVQVSDIAVDLSGERVVAAKGLEVGYDVFQMISKGVIFSEIKLIEPTITLERDGGGWNVNHLVKKQEKEANREGPRRPIDLQAIEIADGRITIADHTGADGYRLPEVIEDLDLKASYAYAPVHYSVVIERASMRSSSPQMALTELTGKLAVRDDNLYVESMSISTTESWLKVDGVIEDYLSTPVLKITTTGKVSLPEFGRVLPAAGEYALHPQFNVKAWGPADKLLLDLDVQSETGNVRGKLTTDVKAPDFAVRGDVDVERLDLASIVQNPAHRSDITGQAHVDLRVASATASKPIAGRLAGSFTFRGPAVLAAGYQARNVKATGSFDGGRINLDASAAAYGGTATARGFVALPAPGRRVTFDLRGRADHVDLRNLPPRLGVPTLATDLSVSEYHVTGTGTAVKGTVVTGTAVTGTAVLNRSTVEGATLDQGTYAEFRTGADGIEYSARGSASDLDLPRIGRVLKIAALDKAAYEGRMNGDFDVHGTVPPARRGAKASRARDITVDARGTLRDTTIMGGRLPQLTYETHLANSALSVTADGRFESFNPATLANRKTLDGEINGTLKGSFQIADVSAPMTPAAITADATVALEKSSIGGLALDTARVEGKYAAEVADLKTLQVSGPDVKVDASGRVALDQTSASNLKYHVEAIDLGDLGRLAGQADLSGSAVLDGTITGNARSLQTTGALDGSNLGYRENTALDVNSRYSVTVPDLEFKKAHVEADTTATLVKAGRVELSAVTAKTTFEGDRLQFTTNVKEQQRELDATGTLILHPDHQEVHLPQLALRTQGIEWRSAPGAELTMKYAQDRVQIDNLRLTSGDQALTVNGAFAMTGESPAGEIKVQASNVDLQQIETLLLMNHGFAGRLTADATISGTLKNPIVDGHAGITNGAFQNYKYESLNADVDYTGNRLGIDATLQQSATESITAKGSVPTSLFKRSGAGHVAATEGDLVDLQVTTTALNLGIVQAFTTQVTNVAGTLEADVHVTGSGEDPHVEGHIDIKGGAFGVPAGGVSYSGLNTRIDLEPDRLRLQKFAILDEHGQPLHVSGELAVHERQVGAVNLAIDSDNFEVIDNELGDVGIDSNLTITGELRRPKVHGTIRLEAARLEVDRILQLFYDPYAVEELPSIEPSAPVAGTGMSAQEATASALRKAETTPNVPGSPAQAEEGAAPASGGAFKPVELDVRLRIPDNMVLRGRKLRPGGPNGASLGDMNITVGGDLQIVKPADGQVILLGTVETVRGTYAFQGRRFDLQRGGALRFMGEPQPNPAIDITAVRTIPNTGVEARVRIQGTVKAPKLSLTSTPPLEESDILALIVFNRPVNELGTGERASLAETAGGIASGFLAAPLGESIGRALDLDLFEISTTTDEGELGAGLTLGQQIGDRAFVKMRQQFGERNITEFLLEYQLTDFMRLQTTAAPETSGSANRIGQRRVERAGIDLVFFFSY
jgi:autotransporter translocation and assembly factor TamB